MSDDMPKDPFGSLEGSMDLAPWAANCRTMYLALVGSGFKEREALEFTMHVTAAMLSKAIK
jgi:hypothetical protein